MRLGEGKKYVEKDWKKRAAYTLLGEPYVPGWIWLQHVLRSIGNLPLNGKPVKLLDAGCSRGDLLTYLAERHPRWSLVGLELEGDRIEMAESIRRRVNAQNVSYLRADICHLPFRNEFDVVIGSDVMEHIPDDRAAFLNLTQALKPGGYLLITSPSVPQPRHLRSVAWREQRVGFEPSEYGHVKDGYSTDGLKDCSKRLARTRLKSDTRMADGARCRSTGSSPSATTIRIRSSLRSFILMVKTLAYMDLYNEPAHGAAVLGVTQKRLNGNGAK